MSTSIQEFSRGGVTAEYHEAAGVAGLTFFVASIRDGVRIIDTHETDAFSDDDSRERAEADAIRWCEAQVKRWASDEYGEEFSL